jgi:hypothetical protein
VSLSSTNGVWRLGAAIMAAAAICIAGLAGDGQPAGAPVAAAPAAQQPNFDMFANRDFWYADQYSNQASDIFPLHRTYSTGGATLEPGESAPCAPIASSIWVAYSADRAGRLDITIDGSGFDATVAAYEWDLAGDFIPSPPGADLIPIDCTEETPGQSAGVSINLTQGREYVVQIGGRAGGGDVRVEATCTGCAPPNDFFDRQHYLSVDAWQPEARRTVETTNATLQPGEQQPCAGIGATVWYSLYTGTTADVEITTEGSNFDTALVVYRLSAANEYAYEPGKLELVACDEDDGTGPASIRIDTDPNQSNEYFIQAGGTGGAGGSLVLTARCVPVCPPYNDNVHSAEYWDVPIIDYSLPTAGATLEAGEPQPCGDIGHTVWFQVTARGDTRIALDTSGSEYATSIAVYETAGFSPPPGTFEMIDCAAGSRLEFAATGNQGYWVEIGGVGDASGRLSLNADCVPSPCPPFHDSVAQPYWFGRPQGPEFYTEFFDVRGATTEPGEPLDCGNMGHTTWWAIDMYEPQPVTPIVFDTVESDFDTAIAVYEVSPSQGYPSGQQTEEWYGLLTRTACFEGGPGERARESFIAEPGKRYYVQIAGRGAASGNLGVRISCDGPCPAENDMMAAAWYAYPPYTHYVDTRATTTEAGEPLPCGNMGKTVWYRFDTSGNDEVTISTAGSDFPTVIAAYTMDSPSPPGGLTNVACSTDGTLTLDANATHYWVQVGGADGASGALNLSINCAVCAIPAGQGGGGVIYAGGSVVPPDTGSGGYLPGARR